MKNAFSKSILFLVVGASLLSLSFSGGHLQKGKDKDPKITKLLIIALVQNIENRKTLEDELKYDFGDYGVEVIPSHITGLRTTKKLTKQAVLDVCKRRGADGVLLVKLVDSEKEESYSYNQRVMYSNGGLPPANSSGVVLSGGQSYSWGTYAYGNYFDAVSSTKIEVQSDIHHITVGHEDAKILFADDDVMRVDDVETSIGKFSKKLTKKIIKKKIIVRQDTK